VSVPRGSSNCARPELTVVNQIIWHHIAVIAAIALVWK